MNINIEKKMTHIWIGPKDPPLKWMNTWKEKMPDWEYSIFTDEMLHNRKWYNQHLIEEYYRRGTWAGVADLIRYELIYERGGFWPEADSECLHDVSELFVEDPNLAYTVYECEQVLPKSISPIMAANPGNKFLDLILRNLHTLKPNQLHEKPHESTGNFFLARILDYHRDKLHIFPSHYFIPQWYRQGYPRYNGPDKVYAEQHWGSTALDGGMPWLKDYSQGV